MREGYKETKIGDLPRSWEVVRQAEVASFYNGRAYKLSEWETTGVPVIRLQNLTGSGKEYYFSNLKLPEHQYCYKGDLLYMWSATFGPMWWFGEKAIYHYHIWKIKHDSSRLNKRFHFYLLDDVTRRMKNESHGSTMLHVTKGGMEKLLIQLPPLPEQQKIAEILSTVDAKIDIIDQQISETQALKKGLMQRLLSRGIGHTEFKESVLGEIPREWEVVEVQQISNVIDSLHKTPTFSESGFPMVRVGDINKEKLNLDNCLKVDGEVFNDFNKNHQPKRGDILMTRVGSFGKTILVDTNSPFCIGQNTVVITRIKNPEFLFHTFNSFHVQKQFEILTNGSSQPSLSLKNIRHLKISFPKDEEQQKIAQILSSVDEKLTVLSEKKSHHQTLKKGLMQQLLTGKIRVQTSM